MKILITAIVGTLFIAPSTTLAQATKDESGLSFALSSGLISTPNYLGDDEQKVIALPNLAINYGDRFSASIDGVRYKVFSQDGLHVGIVGAYHFGRKENPDDSPLVIDGGASFDLIGLGDIDSTVELGSYVAFKHQQFSMRMEIRRGVKSGHNGIYGEIEAKHNTIVKILGTSAFISVGPSVAFGDAAYVSTFFDVNAAQSAASGVSAHDADGGLISIGLHTGVVTPLAKNTSLVSFANYDQLAGDVRSSTLVEERGSRNQVTAGLLLNYSF